MSKDLLKIRAAKYQTPDVEKNKCQLSIEGVLFLLQKEKYIIEFSYIEEVYSVKEIINLPNVPPFVRGLVHFRSRVVTLVDLAAILGLGPLKQISDQVIFLTHEGNSFAFCISELIGNKSVPSASLQNPSDLFLESKREFLKGYTHDGLIVLDGKKILTSQNFLVNQRYE
jgi:chemotaxis signal transduction protein